MGAKFGKLAKQQETLSKNGIVDLDDESYYHPFEYQHLGSLAYIGNSYVKVTFRKGDQLTIVFAVPSLIMKAGPWRVAYSPCTLGDRKWKLCRPLVFADPIALVSTGLSKLP